MVLAGMAAIGLTLVLGLVWWSLTPSWTAPDEPGHYLYARLLADLGRVPTRSDIRPAHETALIANLAQSGWWRYEGRETPHPLPQRLADDPVLAASGAQIEDETPLFYILPAFWLRFGLNAAPQDPASALRWLRLWSLFLRLVAVAAAFILAAKYWPQRPDRALALGLLVGALPMVGFIGGSFNNDSLALAWGAISFALLALASSRFSRVFALLFLLTGPVLVDRSLLFLWPVALIWTVLSWQRLRSYRLAIVVSIIALLVLVLVPNPRWAAGWTSTPALARTRSSGQALHLSDDSSSQRVRVAQTLGGKTILALAGQPLALEVGYWGEPGTPLNLRLIDGVQTQETICATMAEPQQCRLSMVLDPHAIKVRVVAAIGGYGDPAALGEVYFRARLLDPGGRDLLFNGDARLPGRLGAPLFAWLERALPIPTGFFARALAPAAWDAAAQFRYALFAGFTWASFWGYFGWLSRPLPWWGYALLLGLTLLAGWGILRYGMQALRRKRTHTATATDRLVFLAILATCLMLLQVWTPMFGQSWQPQGRYLFPALLPIALLLMIGWETILPDSWRPRFLPGLLLFLIVFNLLSWFIIV